MEKIHEILKHYWGHQSFRPLQEEIIRSVLAGKDTLALLPTGGGKSICFQVPAMVNEGICVVISPLIALMKDQVENLVAKGIPAVCAISGMNRKELDLVFNHCLYGKVKFLYISPERLSSESTRELLLKMKINLLAIDEAHCISQWGYDFRPSYLKIAEVRKLLPGLPVLALTATATKEVRIDVQEKLLFKNPNIFVQSFERKNLSYVVFYEENKLQRLHTILTKVPGTSIVYVRNRAKTKEVSDFLRRNKISSDFYHAGLQSAERSKKQEQWKGGITRVMVSTNAFGMGIDKPDVRTVVHLDFPDSLEAYYQEAGRAGRDGQRAYAVQLYNNSDLLDVEERIKRNFPSLDEIKKVYQAIANYFQLASGAGEGASFDFDFSKVSSVYGIKPSLIYTCLSILESEDYFSLNDAVYLPPRVFISLSGEELYNFEIKNKKFEPILKALLRSSEGVFNGYSPIRISEMGQRTGLTPVEISRQLNLLDEMGIIQYMPVKDSPQITFTKSRTDAKHLRINREQYELRKDRFKKRIYAVTGYSLKKSKCRSSMLLHYLGEETPQRCGCCDFCIERNKLNLSDLEFMNAKEAVKIYLSDNPQPIESLIKNIKSINEDKALKVIQWLLDNKKLSYTEENKLKYKE